MESDYPLRIGWVRTDVPKITLDKDFFACAIQPGSAVPGFIFRQAGYSDIAVSVGSPYYGVIAKGTWEIRPLDLKFFKPTTQPFAGTSVAPFTSVAGAVLSLDAMLYAEPPYGAVGQKLGAYRTELATSAVLTTVVVYVLCMPFRGRKLCEFHVTHDGDFTVDLYGGMQGEQSGLDLKSYVISTSVSTSPAIFRFDHYEYSPDIVWLKCTRTGLTVSENIAGMGVVE